MATIEIYPKLVIEFDSDRGEKALREILDAFIPPAKDIVRGLVSGDSRTQILRWHYHLSTGFVDEAEV